MTLAEQRAQLLDWARWMMQDTQQRMLEQNFEPPWTLAAVNDDRLVMTVIPNAVLPDGTRIDLRATLRWFVGKHQATGVGVFADGWLKTPDGQHRIGEALTVTLQFKDGQSWVSTCPYTRHPLTFGDVSEGEGGLVYDVFDRPVS
jgi:hypothetical protein